MKKSMPKAVWQVQPDNAVVWQNIAQQENLLFEAMEPLTDADTWLPRNKRHAWYLNCGRVNAVHGAFIDVNPASGDPQFKALSRQRCRQSCELAKQVGAGYVVFHSSCFPFLRDAYLDRWSDQCAAFYAQLAEEYDLKICVENSMDLDPTPLRMLMEKMESSSVCVCLDIGHANYSRASLDVWFDQLSQWIGYMHLSDNRGSFDEHLPLGKGSIDWAIVDRLWRQLHGEIPMTLEVGGEDSVRESLAFLRKHGYFGLGEMTDEGTCSASL